MNTLLGTLLCRYNEERRDHPYTELSVLALNALQAGTGNHMYDDLTPGQIKEAVMAFLFGISVRSKPTASNMTTYMLHDGTGVDFDLNLFAQTPWHPITACTLIL